MLQEVIVELCVVVGFVYVGGYGGGWQWEGVIVDQYDVEIVNVYGIVGRYQFVGICFVEVVDDWLYVVGCCVYLDSFVGCVGELCGVVQCRSMIVNVVQFLVVCVFD